MFPRWLDIKLVTVQAKKQLDASDDVSSENLLIALKETIIRAIR